MFETKIRRQPGGSNHPVDLKCDGGLQITVTKCAGRASDDLTGTCSPRNLRTIGNTPETHGGGKRIRTADPLLAKQVLFQLSYTPTSRSRSV